MPHDKIKAATRRRMAKTGEPYSVARRAVINEYKQATEDAAKASPAVPDMTGTGQLSEMAVVHGGAMQAAFGNITWAAEQAARFNATERAAVENLTRTAEMITKFRPPILGMTGSQLAALENATRAAEQAARFNATFWRMGGV